MSRIEANYQAIQELADRQAEVLGETDTLLIVVRAMPTVGEDGVLRSGGTGSTSIATSLAKTIEESFLRYNPRAETDVRFKPGLVLTGEVMRRRFFEQVYSLAHPDLDYLQAKEDSNFHKAFYKWRSYLELQNDDHHDTELDQMITDEVAKLMAERQVVVVDSKVFADIERNRQLFPNMLVIGVTTDDAEATQRMLERELQKNSTTTLEEVANIRAERHFRDADRYKRQNGTDFTADGIRSRSHLVVDNSATWSREEFPYQSRQLSLELLGVMAQTHVITDEVAAMATPLLAELSLPKAS